ncbi:Dabb family protein [Mycoplasmatota bacterium]|nr:Dabb family protein [Mycoplasmatota bacterium]
MVKHIVMWKLKDNYKGQSKLEIAKEIKKRLEGLKEVINEVKTIEVGINQVDDEQAYDLVLYTVFNKEEDLKIYQNHPAHLKVVDYIRQVNEQRVVVDYTVDTKLAQTTHK